MSKQQTAVEWLIKIYLQTNKIDSFDIEQAKELEKQQIEYAETKDIQQLIDRNYAAQIRRGKDLSPIACLGQINEEVKEYNDAFIFLSEKEQKDELADIILSCFTKAKVMGWDIMQVLSEKVEYNEKRLD